MDRVNGNLTREEARRRQLQKYQQDAEKHAAKQKEKLEKKRAEKWERYSHVDMGRKLCNTGQAEDATRAMQQSAYDENVINYILKLERENARLRAEEEKRKENSFASSCSPTIGAQPQNSRPRTSVKNVPFGVNEVVNSPSSRSNVSNSGLSASKVFEENSTNAVPSSSKVNVNCGSQNTHQADEEDADKIKQRFEQEMKSVRDKMQALYNQRLQNLD